MTVSVGARGARRAKIAMPEQFLANIIQSFEFQECFQILIQEFTGRVVALLISQIAGRLQEISVTASSQTALIETTMESATTSVPVIVSTPDIQTDKSVDPPNVDVPASEMSVPVCTEIPKIQTLEEVKAEPPPPRHDWR